MSTKRIFPELDGWSTFSLTGVPQILKGDPSPPGPLPQMKAPLLGPKRLTPGKMPCSMHLAPLTLRLDDRELQTGPSGQERTSHSPCSRSFPNFGQSPAHLSNPISHLSLPCSLSSTPTSFLLFPELTKLFLALDTADHAICLETHLRTVSWPQRGLSACSA